MKAYEPKYMTEADMAEISELLKGEHGDALMAFAKDCSYALLNGFGDGIADCCAKNFFKGTIIGATAFGVIFIGIDQGIIAYKKWKEKKATDVDKPGRVWEV